MKRIAPIATVAALVAGPACARPPDPAEGALAARGRGLRFLVEDQLPHGEFRTLACDQRELVTCRFESSPFVTAFVVPVLDQLAEQLEDGAATAAVGRALDFLAAEQGPGGAWRYYASRDGKAIPPDLDDTSVVSYALARAGRSFEPNDSVFDANRREDGVYRTWIPDDGSPEAKRIYEALAAEVDPAVNANVLLHRGRSEPGACAFVNEQIRSGEARSDWYEDELAIFYMVARAARRADCLRASFPVVVERTLARQRRDGSFGGPLETALALSTLAYAGHDGPEAGRGVAALVAAQRDDGSWPRATFFRGPTTFYGSAAATTAFALEALSGYVASAAETSRPR